MNNDIRATLKKSADGCIAIQLNDHARNQSKRFVLPPGFFQRILNGETAHDRDMRNWLEVHVDKGGNAIHFRLTCLTESRDAHLSGYEMLFALPFDDVMAFVHSDSGNVGYTREKGDDWQC